MAANLDFTPSRERDDYIRVARLLIIGGTRILRNLLHTYHPPEDLATSLNNWQIHLERVARLTQPQKEILYPASGDPVSTNFDISILYKLLRNICGLAEPHCKWDGFPSDGDISLQDDIVRLRFYRNKIFAHVSEGMAISSEDFAKCWEDISKALIRLNKKTSHGGEDNVEEQINKLKYSPIAKDETQEMLEEMRRSLDNQTNAFDRIEKQGDKIYKKIEGLEDTVIQNTSRRQYSRTENPTSNNNNSNNSGSNNSGNIIFNTTNNFIITDSGGINNNYDSISEWLRNSLAAGPRAIDEPPGQVKAPFKIRSMSCPPSPKLSERPERRRYVELSGSQPTNRHSFMSNEIHGKSKEKFRVLPQETPTNIMGTKHQTARWSEGSNQPSPFEGSYSGSRASSPLVDPFETSTFPTWHSDGDGSRDDWEFSILQTGGELSSRRSLPNFSRSSTPLRASATPFETKLTQTSQAIRPHKLLSFPISSQTQESNAHSYSDDSWSLDEERHQERIEVRSLPDFTTPNRSLFRSALGSAFSPFEPMIAQTSHSQDTFQTRQYFMQDSFFTNKPLQGSNCHSQRAGVSTRSSFETNNGESNAGQGWQFPFHLHASGRQTFEESNSGNGGNASQNLGDIRKSHSQSFSYSDPTNEDTVYPRSRSLGELDSSSKRAALDELYLLLCKNGGKMQYADVIQLLSLNGRAEVKKAIMKDRMDKRFSILPGNIIQAKLNFCQKRACDCNPNCPDLHLCCFNLLEGCPFAGNCFNSHDINDGHTDEVIEKANLSSLTNEERHNFLKNIVYTIPKICHYYNISCKRYKCKHGKKCSFLHVCKFWVKGSCFSQCSRAHTFADPATQKILKRNNLHELSEIEIKKKLAKRNR